MQRSGELGESPCFQNIQSRVVHNTGTETDKGGGCRDRTISYGATGGSSSRYPRGCVRRGVVQVGSASTKRLHRGTGHTPPSFLLDHWAPQPCQQFSRSNFSQVSHPSTHSPRWLLITTPTLSTPTSSKKPLRQSLYQVPTPSGALSVQRALGTSPPLPPSHVSEAHKLPSPTPPAPVSPSVFLICVPCQTTKPKPRRRETLGDWWVKEEMWEERMEDRCMDGQTDGQVGEFSHTFNKCLWRANCVPGTVLGTGDTAVNKTQTSRPC